MQDMPVKIVSGVHWKQLPDAIAYEATIPLTYKTKWVDALGYAHNTSDFDTYCAQRGNDPTCAVTRQVLLMGKTLDKYLAIFDTALAPTAFLDEEHESDDIRKKRALDFIGDLASYCCGIATNEHLDSLVMSQNQLKKTLRNLGSTLNKELLNVAENSQKFSDYEKQVAAAFKNLRQHTLNVDKILNETRNAVQQDRDNIAHYGLTMAQLHYSNTLRLVSLVRMVTNNEILNTCRQRYIPMVVVTPQTLIHDLRTLSEELNGMGQELVIPTSEISRYYKIPIADCTVADDNLIVHIRIPIVSHGQKWKLFELLTPFKFEESSCYIMHDPMFLAVSQTSKVPITGSSLETCQVFDNKLCAVPRFSANSNFGPICAFKMFSGATIAELSHHCPFRCHQSKALVISEIERDIYLITNPQPDTNIRCPTNTQTLPDSAYTNPGAVQIHLPCDCNLRIKDEIIIPSRFPCIPDPSRVPKAIHVLPATWSNLQSFVLNPIEPEKNPIFQKFEECLDPLWSFRTPHLNLSSASAAKAAAIAIADAVNDATSTLEEHTTSHSSIYLYWNLAITFAILYIFLKRPAAAALGFVHPTFAQQAGQTTLYTAMSFTILTYCCLLACVVYGIYIYYKKKSCRCPLFRKRRAANEDEENEVSLTEYPTPSSLGEGTLQLPNGKRIKVLLRRDEPDNAPQRASGPPVVVPRSTPQP